MKTIALLLMIIAGLVDVPAATAADSLFNNFYVLGGVGQTINDNDQSTIDNALNSVGATGYSSSLGKPTVYKLQVGYQVTEYLGIEGGYLGSNDETYTASGGNLAGPVSASVSITGWNLDVVGTLPLPNRFSLLGKVGVANIRGSGTITGPGGSASTGGNLTDSTFGIGAKYDFNNGAFVRLDLDRYNVGNSTFSNRVNIWTVDLGYKF